MGGEELQAAWFIKPGSLIKFRQWHWGVSINAFYFQPWKKSRIPANGLCEALPLTYSFAGS